MKLIDLLVKELPKLGGWPDGVNAVEQDSEGQLFEMDSDYYSEFKLKKCDGWIADVVTKQQYESALAASQKPAWNGGGLPPSGVECEARLRCNDAEWFFFRCVGVDCGVAFGWAGKEAVTLGEGSYEFRPLRTEAERKRDAAAEAIHRYMPEFIHDTPNEHYHAKKIYDAIAAGKIPGVKLED